MAIIYCSTCGFPLEKTQQVTSKHTGLSYCTDLTECRRRAENNLTFEEISQLANQAMGKMRA